MFEISLTNDNKAAFAIAPADRHGYDAALHKIVQFQDEFISINGLRYLQEKNDFNESDQLIVCVCGKVFNQLGCSENLLPLSAVEVSNRFLADGKKLLDKIKGHFIIVIYDKKKKTLFIAKDQLGLKHLYYKSEGDCFYISTNLNDFRRIDFEYNYSAVLEKILFTYPIGDESYLKDVFMLKQGIILSYSDSKLRQEEYFNIESLFNPSNGLKRLDQGHFIQIFEKSVLQRANAAEKLNVSLTGGFDGRANVAVLLKNHRDFRAYSFGKKGGENTTVPLDVADKIKLNYLPVYLDEEYEKNYSECALDAIYFSDGISIFQRANYIYALKKIAGYSNLNITGLIGGEVLAPVHLKSDYLNNLYYRLIYLQEKLQLKTILAKNNLGKYMKLGFIEQNKLMEKIEENINKRIHLLNDWKKQDHNWMYYLKDLMTLGFPRFYGNQMHLERYYCDNLSPFYDFDIIKYLFSTEYISIYRTAFVSSPFFRIKNRRLQSLIIKELFPELGKIPVDRGYPPNYNLDCRQVFIPFYYYQRIKKLKTAPPDFASPLWCKILFDEKLDLFGKLDDMFFNSSLIKKYIAGYETESYSQDFNHLLSVALWLGIEN